MCLRPTGGSLFFNKRKSLPRRDSQQRVPGVNTEENTQSSVLMFNVSRSIRLVTLFYLLRNSGTMFLLYLRVQVQTEGCSVLLPKRS